MMTGGRGRKMELLERLSILLVLVAALSCVEASGESRREVELLDQQALEYKELLKASESKEKEAVDRANTLEKQLAEVKRVNSDLTDTISDLQQQLESLQANSGPEVNRQLEEDLTVSSQMKRVKRDSEPECESPDVYWDPNENRCKWCECPNGKQRIAETSCGCGTLVGETLCGDCPPMTYRSVHDTNQTCHPCSTCDVNAVMLSNCTKSTDAVCRCKEGMVMITHCVSCIDYPDAKNCTSEPKINSTTLKPSINATESSENSTTCRDDKQDYTSTRMYSGWEVALMCAACFSVPSIFFFLLLIKKNRQLEKLQREAERDVRTNRTNGNTSSVQMQQSETTLSPTNGVRETPDSHGSPTQNCVLENSAEASGLLHGNKETSI